jgi:GTP:adenosylcobinamide-phosphate guanylyltransferase
MDAIVIAGGKPEVDEPLYEETKGGFKALLEVAGKPMVQWVLDALNDAANIEHVVIIGLPADSPIQCSKAVSFIPTQGDMVDNVRGGVAEVLKANPASVKVVIASADIPGINAEMVDWLVAESERDDLDVYYNIIPRSIMEARYPTSKRSYTHLKDHEVCGGDMNVLATRMVTSNTDIWDKLVAARKNPFKQAALIGFDTLFLLLIRAITLDRAAELVTKRLNITGRAILCPYAEVGMDVDKPHQLDIVRQDLAGSA